MTEELQSKTQTLMYALTKNAARYSYMEFLEDLGITDSYYENINEIWKDKLGIVPYV